MANATRPDGEVSIQAGGLNVAGWTDINIGGGLDTLPAVFDLGITERVRSSIPDFAINPGDACTVKIGGDLVLTGYVNRVQRSYNNLGHTVRISGRSRCQDLVDCSATPDALSINNAPIGSVARTLAAKFDGPITVLTPDGDGSGIPYTLGINWGETPWEIISAIATYEGLLVHDDARGNLVICKVGTTSFASGFVEGVNVQEVQASDADDMLFSDYIPLLNAQDSLAIIGPGGNSAGAIVKDPLVKRRRPMVVISDQPLQGESLAQKRAVWEATRRRGHSRSVSVTADSWRDSAGTLWTHNVLAPVSLPSARVTNATWIVAAWNFVRNDKEGTVCRVTLMPPDAFAVQPTVLTNVPVQVAAANRSAAIGSSINTTPGPAVTAPNAGDASNPRRNDGYGL